MDAHSFRILSALFAPLLNGARIDKIYAPFPDVTIFHCFGKVGKFQFAVQSHKQSPRYFLQYAPLPNPATPSVPTMRLRKYLINAHFGDAVIEASSRTLALPIMRRGEITSWMVCSPSEGIKLRHTLPENFPQEMTWPMGEALHELRLPEQMNDPATWLAYSSLTPLLRKTLAALEWEEALALLVDLESGSDSLFFYGSDKEQATHYFAWPLPDTLCKTEGLVPIEPGHILLPQEGQDTKTEKEIPRNFLLTSFIDEKALHAAYSLTLHKDDSHYVKRQEKRHRRKERALAQEAERLQKMVERQKDALLIQENLWRLDGEAKFNTLSLSTTLPTGETVAKNIRLNPTLSIRDNMLDIFKKAEKGKRGLSIVAERQEQHANLTPKGNIQPSLSTTNTPPSSKVQTQLPPISSLHCWSSLVELEERQKNKSIGFFLSSDGFTILRGKNAQGNKQLLKLCKPHDIWLHVQNGPSAHAIIRRDHAHAEVPERTIREAAELVAEKSWLKESDSAEVMLALVKNVQPIKGASAGTVRVDKMLQTVYIRRSG